MEFDKRFKHLHYKVTDKENEEFSGSYNKNLLILKQRYESQINLLKNVDRCHAKKVYEYDEVGWWF